MWAKDIGHLIKMTHHLYFFHHWKPNCQQNNSSHNSSAASNQQQENDVVSLSLRLWIRTERITQVSLNTWMTMRPSLSANSRGFWFKALWLWFTSSSKTYNATQMLLGGEWWTDAINFHFSIEIEYWSLANVFVMVHQIYEEKMVTWSLTFPS